MPRSRRDEFLRTTREHLARIEFAAPALNRRPRNPGRAFDQDDAAVADRARFGRRPNAPRPFREHGCQRRELRSQAIARCVVMTRQIHRNRRTSRAHETACL